MSESFSWGWNRSSSNGSCPAMMWSGPSASRSIARYPSRHLVGIGNDRKWFAAADIGPGLGGVAGPVSPFLAASSPAVPGCRPCDLQSDPGQHRFHGRSPLSEIFNDLTLAHAMPSGAVHPNTCHPAEIHGRRRRRLSRNWRRTSATIARCSRKRQPHRAPPDQLDTEQLRLNTRYSQSAWPVSPAGKR
jgi:hypothetical protein